MLQNTHFDKERGILAPDSFVVEMMPYTNTVTVWVSINFISKTAPKIQTKEISPVPFIGKNALVQDDTISEHKSYAMLRAACSDWSCTIRSPISVHGRV